MNMFIISDLNLSEGMVLTKTVSAYSEEQGQNVEPKENAFLYFIKPHIYKLSDDKLSNTVEECTIVKKYSLTEESDQLWEVLCENNIQCYIYIAGLKWGCVDDEMRKEAFQILDGEWLYQAGISWKGITEKLYQEKFFDLHGYWLFLAGENWPYITEEMRNKAIKRLHNNNYLLAKKLWKFPEVMYKIIDSKKGDEEAIDEKWSTYTYAKDFNPNLKVSSGLRVYGGGVQQKYFEFLERNDILLILRPGKEIFYDDFFEAYRVKTAQVLEEHTIRIDVKTWDIAIKYNIQPLIYILGHKLESITNEMRREALSNLDDYFLLNAINKWKGIPPEMKKDSMRRISFKYINDVKL